MKKKINYQVIIIILLLIVLIVMCFLYFKDDRQNTENIEEQMEWQSESKIENMEATTSSTNIKTTSEIVSALTEEIELHATYYLQESYLEENKELEAGENMIAYTNGTYLQAPYRCVVTKINIPEEGKQCTKEHSIQISSINLLAVKISIDESKINELSLGQKAEIQIPAFEDKTLIGNITNISSTANNGKFTVTVEFENDGQVKIGMTANITIK